MILKRRLLFERLQTALPAGFLGALLLFAIWPWLPGGEVRAKAHTIVFYGFSILGDTFTTALFPDFEAVWRSTHADPVEFISSFGGSGTVTNQLAMGVPASLAVLSLELDAQRLADAHVTAPQSWLALPQRGVVNRTPIILLVRPGNPLGIQDWADLARPGVKVVHPDPLTSGAANWAIMAEYGAAVRQHPEQADAGFELLLGIWRNVVAQASSAKAARAQFDTGFGDVLVTYEQEILWDKLQGRLVGEIVYPRSTILTEHTLVVVDRNITPSDRPVLNDFVAYLWSERAQNLFIAHGFQSVMPDLNSQNPGFGRIADPFLIADFGGWSTAKRDIVDGIWKKSVLTELGK
ncbi:MAG: sulfate ABC transporter substrate-binding protein [Herpetosiphon sp.]